MKPLAGIKVIDLTHALAGPTCTYHMSLLGADVVKVERVGTGDPFRQFYELVEGSTMTAAFMAANGGKRSLTLDLAQEEGQQVLRRLIAGADVFVQNYRPGAVDRMGLSWENCKAINPKLIYCSISGFGQTGPMKDLVCYDHTVQAMSGLMTLSGDPDSDEPVKVGFTIVDFMTGYVAYSAIFAAVLQRTKSNVGQFIDVAMLDSALVMMMAPVLRSIIGGKPHERTGNRGGRGGSVVTLRTGKGWLFIGANYAHQFKSLCKALGEEEFFLRDPRFATEEAREVNAKELAVALEGFLAKKTAVEWETLLLEAGCPAGAVRTIDEIRSHPQLAERDLFIEGHASGLDRPITLMNSGFIFEHDGPGLTRPVPEVGEHTDEVLLEYGFSNDEISRLRDHGTI